MAPPPNQPERPNRDLSDEVDAFLRSVQQRQGQQRKGQHPRSQPRRKPPTAAPASYREPVVAEVVEGRMSGPAVPPVVVEGGGSHRGTLGAESVAQEAEGVGRRAQSLGEQSLGARSLGAAIDQTDERVAEQIHDTFDHQLGQFDAVEANSDENTQANNQADAGATALSADLRAMLADPHDIRRAIVLSEILNPPVDRW